MTDFVLDNSVTMRWLLESENASDQAYAEKVLTSLQDVGTLVPDLWRLEATNVLLNAEKHGVINAGEAERFIMQLENLPIQVDSLTSRQAFNKTLAVARAYKLSSYDAAYLELAIREGLPLASLDKALLEAARKAEVGIYLKQR